MAKAIWNGQVVAESDKYEVVERQRFFPPQSLKQHFTPSSHTTRCFWKGTAHYYNLVVDGKENKDAAWYCPEPAEAAKNIKDHVAFWHGVQVSPVITSGHDTLSFLPRDLVAALRSSGTALTMREADRTAMHAKPQAEASADLFQRLAP